MSPSARPVGPTVTVSFPSSWTVVNVGSADADGDLILLTESAVSVAERVGGSALTTQRQVAASLFEGFSARLRAVGVSVAATWGRYVRAGSDVRFMRAWATLATAPNPKPSVDVASLLATFEASGVDPGSAEPTAVAWNEVALPAGDAVRVVREVRAPDSSPTGRERHRTVQFVVPIADGRCLALLTCGSPDSEYAERFDDVFDALAATLAVV